MEKKFYPGLRHVSERTVTREDVVKFAETTGDFNPIHLDEEAGKNSIFGKCVAHGMLTACFMTTEMTKFFGYGIYLGQTLKFVKPVGVGDTVKFEIEILDFDEETNKLKAKTTCFNSDGQEVICGEAKVLVL